MATRLLLSSSVVLAVAVAAGAACAPAQVATQAEIARVDDGDFRACTVTLGWSLAELTDACGVPDTLVDWSGHAGDQCAVYRTEAQAFSGAPGARYLAVCMGKREARKKLGTTKRDEASVVEAAPEPMVVAVYGLSSLGPPIAMSEPPLVPEPEPEAPVRGHPTF